LDDLSPVLSQRFQLSRGERIQVADHSRRVDAQCQAVVRAAVRGNNVIVWAQGDGLAQPAVGENNDAQKTSSMLAPEEVLDEAGLGLYSTAIPDSSACIPPPALSGSGSRVEGFCLPLSLKCAIPLRRSGSPCECCIRQYIIIYCLTFA